MNSKEPKEQSIQIQKKKILRNYIILSAILCLAVGCPIVILYEVTEIQLILLGTILITISSLYYFTKDHKLDEELKQCNGNTTSKDASTNK